MVRLRNPRAKHWRRPNLPLIAFRGRNRLYGMAIGPPQQVRQTGRCHRVADVRYRLGPAVASATEVVDKVCWCIRWLLERLVRAAAASRFIRVVDCRSGAVAWRSAARVPSCVGGDRRIARDGRCCCPRVALTPGRVVRLRQRELCGSMWHRDNEFVSPSHERARIRAQCLNHAAKTAGRYSATPTASPLHITHRDD